MHLSQRVNAITDIEMNVKKRKKKKKKEQKPYIRLANIFGH